MCTVQCTLLTYICLHALMYVHMYVSTQGLHVHKLHMYVCVYTACTLVYMHM